MAISVSTCAHAVQMVAQSALQIDCNGAGNRLQASKHGLQSPDAFIDAPIGSRLVPRTTGATRRGNLDR